MVTDCTKVFVLNMADSEIKFFVTHRGKDILQYQHFLFRFAYNNVNTKESTWYCIKKMMHNCNATIFLTDGKFGRFRGFHTHENETKRLICFEFKKKLNEEVQRRDESSLAEMYKEFMVEYQKNMEVGFKIPDFESIKKVLYNKMFVLRLKTPENKTEKEDNDSGCLSNQSESNEESSPKRQDMLLRSHQGENPEELPPPPSFTSYKPHCSTANDNSGIESVIITDLRTIATSDLQAVLPSLQSIPAGADDSFDKPENEAEADLADGSFKDGVTAMDEGIKQPQNFENLDTAPLHLTNQEIQNSWNLTCTSNLPNIVAQTDPNTTVMNGIEEKLPYVNATSVMYSHDSFVSAEKPTKENVQPINDGTLSASMYEPQRLSHSILAKHSTSKYSPLSTINNTCSTILNQLRLPSPVANPHFKGIANNFNNSIQSQNIMYLPYMYHPYQRMYYPPKQHPTHSIDSIHSPAEKPLETNPVSSCHIESGTTSTTCLNKVQSVTILNQSNNNPPFAMISNSGSSVANFPPNLTALPPTVSCPTNNIQSNQRTFINSADTLVPLSALPESMNQTHVSQSIPKGLGQHYTYLPGIHQNGPMGVEAYVPGNRIPSHPVKEIWNPGNIESSGCKQRKNKRGYKATENENNQTGPIIVNSFAAKEISSSGLVRPKDKLDLYSEYLAEEMRTIDPRTCALIQKVVGDILFDARTKTILCEK